jgi:hypothetical protein
MSLTLLEAAKAKMEGKRVEGLESSGKWVEWRGEGWNKNIEYRIAPEPKKKVKLLAWFDGMSLIYRAEACSLKAAGWKRMPNLDLEGEVEE